MRAALRQLGVRLNASYWFLPALLTLAALALSIVTYVIDVRLGPNWISRFGWIHAAKPDGARALLSAIATGMLGVSGTVFSITIAAVVYASGNYGPRLLTNFMTDRGNQLSLGVFIADFTYALMTLRTIRSPGESGGGTTGFVPELSLLVALVLTLIAIGVLVYFLHHVPDSIRINSVVAAIGRRALRDVEKRYPDPAGDKRLGEGSSHKGRPIVADEVGYIGIIDFDTLRSIADRHEVAIRLALRAGDFVHPGIPLLHVSGEQAEGIADDLRDAFAIGSSRTPSQDIEYSIDELVEIALRALSPGINDPFTAITCLHWLGAVTASIGGRDLGRDPDGEPYGTGGVYAIIDDFDHFVRRGFGSVRTSAAANDIAGKLFVETLEAAAVDVEPGRRVALHRQARLLLDQASAALTGPALDELRRRVEEYASAT